MEKIRLVPTDSAEPEEFYVLEQVKLGGKMYLLVTDEEEGDGMALILRDDAEEGSDEENYRKGTETAGSQDHPSGRA